MQPPLRTAYREKQKWDRLWKQRHACKSIRDYRFELCSEAPRHTRDSMSEISGLNHRNSRERERVFLGCHVLSCNTDASSS